MVISHYWIIVSAPVPFLFLWTLDFGIWTWIWDLDLWLGFGTGFGLDNNENEITRSNFDDDWLPSRLVSGFAEEVGALKELMLGKKNDSSRGSGVNNCYLPWYLRSWLCVLFCCDTRDSRFPIVLNTDCSSDILCFLFLNIILIHNEWWHQLWN